MHSSCVDELVRRTDDGESPVVVGMVASRLRWSSWTPPSSEVPDEASGACYGVASGPAVQVAAGQIGSTIRAPRYSVDEVLKDPMEI
jgi:hypothetical protein